MGRKKTENRITDESLFISTRAVDRRGTRYGKLVCIEPTEKRQSGSAVLLRQSGGASVIAAMRPSSVAKALLPGKSRAVVVSNGK